METDFSLSVTDLLSEFHVIYFTITIRWTLSRKDLLTISEPEIQEEKKKITW